MFKMLKLRKTLFSVITSPPSTLHPPFFFFFDPKLLLLHIMSPNHVLQAAVLSQL